jgi:(1->4)-alpha-D-glucan 1-alpha-D-glucosylmutase
MNYRRFFDVSELIGMRVENAEVFAATHSAILRWVEQGLVTGLRIDHVDGLFKPREYLERLSQIENRPYIVVEKILLEDETLPEDWPIEGTSGYDFLGMVNGCLSTARTFSRLQDTYNRFTGLDWTFEDAAYQQKRWIIRHLFRGEMFAMSLHLEMIAELDRHGRDLSPEELRKGWRKSLPACPCIAPISKIRGHAERDVVISKPPSLKPAARNPRSADRCTTFFAVFCSATFPRHSTMKAVPPGFALSCAGSNLTGPITAKGVEDTTMYVYNRFVSMNEVGGQHSDVPLGAFHAFNTERRKRWPAAMNTISTHDTKRSADVRARLNVLSEIPMSGTGTCSAGRVGIATRRPC